MYCQFNVQLTELFAQRKILNYPVFSVPETHALDDLIEQLYI